jgi:hypothetical protein
MHLHLCMIELERHARHAPLLVRLGGKKGSKGVGWAHGAVASAKGLQISAILTPVLCAVPNMNQGGAPKGKRASTLHRDREKREEADPLLKDKRRCGGTGGKTAFYRTPQGTIDYFV